jgi:hypothetical protein
VFSVMKSVEKQRCAPPRLDLTKTRRRVGSNRLKDILSMFEISLCCFDRPCLAQIALEERL